MPQHGESGWETRACSPNRKTFWVLATESMWLYGMLELERIRFSHNNFETVCMEVKSLIQHVASVDMIITSNGIEVSPGPKWHNLYRWIVSQASEFLSFETVYLITDNRDLLASTVKTTPGLSHWPMVAAWWRGSSMSAGLCTDYYGYGTGKNAPYMGWHLHTGCLCLPLPQHQLCSNLIAIVYQSHSMKFRNCGAPAMTLLIQLTHLRQIRRQQAQLRQRTRENGLLTPGKPPNSQAHQRNFPSREASSTF